MAKNIVVCCDGTSNEFDGARTNVVKLYQMLVHDPQTQATYYHPGLGTMEAAGALTAFSRWWTKLAGFAFGYGLKNDIRDIYVFLMNHYEPGDRVFLFGFSRGAYTVRAVAAVLHLYGLVRKGNEPLVPYAVRMMKRINNARANAKKNDKSAVSQTLILAQQFKQTFAACECKPYFVGVWDTVNSVGWVENPLRLPFTGHNPSIEIGRHALAIDERRAFFQPNLWRPRPKPERTGPRDLMQVWFPGSHGDVGGGYPENDCGLSKIALEWMLREAQHKGLLTDPDREARIMGEAGGSYARPEATATLHDELKTSLKWRLLQLIPKKQWRRIREGGRDVWIERRRLNIKGVRPFPREPLIHDAAYARDAAYIAKLPADAIRVSTLPPLGAAQYDKEPVKARA